MPFFYNMSRFLKKSKERKTLNRSKNPSLNTEKQIKIYCKLLKNSYLGNKNPLIKIQLQIIMYLQGGESSCIFVLSAGAMLLAGSKSSFRTSFKRG